MAGCVCVCVCLSDRVCIVAPGPTGSAEEEPRPLRAVRSTRSSPGTRARLISACRSYVVLHLPRSLPRRMALTLPFALEIGFFDLAILVDLGISHRRSDRSTNVKI